MKNSSSSSNSSSSNLDRYLMLHLVRARQFRSSNGGRLHLFSKSTGDCTCLNRILAFFFSPSSRLSPPSCSENVELMIREGEGRRRPRCRRVSTRRFPTKVGEVSTTRRRNNITRKRGREKKKNHEACSSVFDDLESPE